MSKKGTKTQGTVVCEYCEQEEESASSCARCGLVKYCSKDCQRAH